MGRPWLMLLMLLLRWSWSISSPPTALKMSSSVPLPVVPRRCRLGEESSRRTSMSELDCGRAS